MRLGILGAGYVGLVTGVCLSDFGHNVICIDKNKTKIKDNVFIGSNSSLVAPLVIEEGSIVGAGSVITKKVRKKSLALTRSLQIEIKNYKRKHK